MKVWPTELGLMFRALRASCRSMTQSGRCSRRADQMARDKVVLALPPLLVGNCRFRSGSPGPDRVRLFTAGTLARGSTSSLPLPTLQFLIWSAAIQPATSEPWTPPEIHTVGPGRPLSMMYRVVAYLVPAAMVWVVTRGRLGAGCWEPPPDPLPEPLPDPPPELPPDPLPEPLPDPPPELPPDPLPGSMPSRPSTVSTGVNWWGPLRVMGARGGGGIWKAWRPRNWLAALVSPLTTGGPPVRHTRLPLTVRFRAATMASAISLVPLLL